MCLVSSSVLMWGLCVVVLDTQRLPCPTTHPPLLLRVAGTSSPVRHRQLTVSPARSPAPAPRLPAHLQRYAGTLTAADFLSSAPSPARQSRSPAATRTVDAGVTTGSPSTMHRLGAGGQRPAWHPQPPQRPAVAADASTHAAAAADHTIAFIRYMGAEEGMAQLVGQPGAEEESMLSGGSQPSSAWQE
jgi:hypothetical protein